MSNRARIAARAAQNRPVRINMPAHLAPAASVTVTGPVRKTRALPMTGAMRSGDGAGVSAWARPAEIGGSLGLITRDRKWSATVSES